MVPAAGSDPGQRAQMRRDAACQRTEVVAAFQAGHDAPLRMALGHPHDAQGDPFVVGLDQTELSEVVSGRKASRRGIQFASIRSRISAPRVYGGIGTLIMLVPLGTAPLYG